MPAVTVDDLTVLQRLRAPELGDTVRPVNQVIDAPSGYEGEGFPVRRAFAGVDLSDLDPFIHMDQMGEVDYAPGEPKGTPWHPHRGFETVTYIIDGGISVHVWPNDHPPAHVHILKKSEPDNEYVKINLETAELEGDLPPWADRKQLKKMQQLVRGYHELFAGWWEKNHGEVVTLLP